MREVKYEGFEKEIEERVARENILLKQASYYQEGFDEDNEDKCLTD